jgi:hypothetical protein
MHALKPLALKLKLITSFRAITAMYSIHQVPLWTTPDFHKCPYQPYDSRLRPSSSRIVWLCPAPSSDAATATFHRCVFVCCESLRLSSE